MTEGVSSCPLCVQRSYMQHVCVYVHCLEFSLPVGPKGVGQPCFLGLPLSLLTGTHCDLAIEQLQGRLS